MADQARQPADEARRQIRALRAATRTARDVAVLGAAANDLGSALLDLCPWCKKGMRKVVNPPFCPHCHRDVLSWSEELQEEWESQRKVVRAANRTEKKDREMELLRKVREDGVVNKTWAKKATNRE